MSDFMFRTNLVFVDNTKITCLVCKYKYSMQSIELQGKLNFSTTKKLESMEINAPRRRSASLDHLPQEKDESYESIVICNEIDIDGEINKLQSEGDNAFKILSISFYDKKQSLRSVNFTNYEFSPRHSEKSEEDKPTQKESLPNVDQVDKKTPSNNTYDKKPSQKTEFSTVMIKHLEHLFPIKERLKTTKNFSPHLFNNAKHNLKVNCSSTSLYYQGHSPKSLAKGHNKSEKKFNFDKSKVSNKTCETPLTPNITLGTPASVKAHRGAIPKLALFRNVLKKDRYSKGSTKAGTSESRSKISVSPLLKDSEYHTNYAPSIETPKSLKDQILYTLSDDISMRRKLKSEEVLKTEPTSAQLAKNEFIKFNQIKQLTMDHLDYSKILSEFKDDFKSSKQLYKLDLHPYQQSQSIKSENKVDLKNPLLTSKRKSSKRVDFSPNKNKSILKKKEDPVDQGLLASPKTRLTSEELLKNIKLLKGKIKVFQMKQSTDKKFKQLHLVKKSKFAAPELRC